jgi:hypothetical protein
MNVSSRRDLRYCLSPVQRPIHADSADSEVLRNVSRTYPALVDLHCFSIN